jgi:hypothetical protein
MLAAVTADGPLHPIPAIASASVTAVTQIAWWSRAKAPKEPKPQKAKAEPEQTREQVWAARIAPAAVPESALTDVAPIPGADGQPNGFSALINLNVSGVIRHTPDSITGDTVKKIAVAYKADPGNIVIEPSRTDQVPMLVFDRNPLEPTVAWNGPIEPGSFRHFLGNSVTGKEVFHDLWIPGHGALHGMAVGSTGSGKSETMLTLLNMERHTTDPDGNPLVASWLLDPQHGASFPGWREQADVFASEPGDIADALEGAVEELTRRVKEMADRGWKLWIPTPGGPLISITLDELLIFLKGCPRPLAQRIIKALTIIANGGRKASVGIRIGTQYPSLDDIGDDMSIRDALMGYVMLLRTGNRQTGHMVAAGRPVGDAALLPERFADGSRTPGVMYYLGGTADAGVMMRAAVADEKWMGRGSTCRTGLNPAAAARARREDEAFDSQEQSAIAAIQAAEAAAAGAELDTWPATERLLAQCDRPMRTGEIATLLGRPVNVVSQACGRAKERGKVLGDGHQGWVLPQYASVLEGAR